MKKLRVFLIALVMVFGVLSLTSCGKVEEPTVSDVEEVLKDCGYIKSDDKDDKKDEDEEDEDADSGEFIMAGVSANVSVLDKKDDEEDAEEEDTKEDKKEDEDEDEDDKKSDTKPGEPVDKYTYEVKIDKCKINDDKDQAKVEATLVEKLGSVETTTEFKIKFKLKDDKKTWKAKEKDVEKGDSTSTLFAGVPDDEAEKLIKDWYSISVGDSYIDTEDITKLDKKDEKLDSEGLKDTVTYSVEAEGKRYNFSFDCDIQFYYSEGYGTDPGYWYLYDIKVDDSSVKKEASEAFKFEPDEKALPTYIQDYGVYFYVLGESYQTDNEGVTIENVKLEKADPGDSTYVYVPATFDINVKGKIKVSMSAEIEYYFSDDKGWYPDYISSTEVTAISGDWVGTWEGSNKGGDKVTVEFTDQFIEDEYGSSYPLVKVTVVSKDAKKGTYSWKAKLNNYSVLTEEYMSVYFSEWEKKPLDNSEYDYKNISGNVENGKWTYTDWSDTYVFTKKDAVASADTATKQ